MQLEALVGIAFGKVGETLGKQRGVEERDGDTVDGLYLRALVIDISDRTANAITLNPVTNPLFPTSCSVANWQSTAKPS